MKAKRTLKQKVLAVFLAAVILVGALPIAAFAATSNSTSVADPATVEGWKNWFTADSNRYSGNLYIDKSVYTASDIENSYFKEIEDKLSFGKDNFGNDNFLVSLSAIGSNTEIVGYSVTPTDTMIVLDLSSSMSSDNTRAMVQSTNRAIETLLELNNYNRVGVVLYSGTGTANNAAGTGTATVLLPLGRYTTNITEEVNNVDYDVFVSFSNGSVSVARRTQANRQTGGVKAEGSNSYVNASKSVGGSTYIQNGLYIAYNQFPSGDDTVIPDGKLQAGTQRKPIVVLMSDGAPTTGTTSYSNIGTSNTGNGGSDSATNQMGFLTQLTASWVKANLKTKYNGTAPLFYTLGLGTSNNAVATGVLNPASTANGASGYWTDFLEDGSVNLSLPNTNGRGNFSTTINKADNSQLIRDYVDKYWSADGATDMIKAFEEIVEQIIIQSRYYATLVTTGLHEHDGYISFTDEIGYGMEVKQMEGIHIGGDTLVTGDMFAEYMFNGQIRNDRTGVYTELGAELISALKTRFNISENDALTLINTAINNGDIVYNEQNGTFSNLVSWYADENNDYLAPYNAITKSIPQGAKYKVKSYIYLGDVQQNHIETDMLYTLIRVREDLKSGRQIVDANLPAALLPMITYKITVEGDTLTNESLESMTNNIGEKEPACLLFEVGLRDDITPYNIVEKMSLGGTQLYQRNADGTYYFYTNRWKKDATTPFTVPEASELPTGIYNHGLVGSTEAHFVPSIENERYYYTKNTIVLEKDGDTYKPYTGAKPTGEGYYHEYTWVELDGNTPKIASAYNPITANAIKEVVESGTNGWAIPAGTPKRYFGEEVHGERFHTHKESNPTETLLWSNYPASVYETGGNEQGYHIFAYLGNNGRVTVAPGQGIKLTKRVENPIAGATTEFQFEIKLSVDGAFRYQLEKANGSVENAIIETNNQILNVSLSDGDTLYIIDIPTGATYTVTEKYDRYYIGNSQNSTGTIAEYTINSVDFVNTERGYGSLLVEKDVTHPFGNADIPEALANKEFDITVTFDGSANDLNNIENNKGITANNNGTVYSFKLKDGGDILFTNIPEGISYTVTETLDNDDRGFELVTQKSSGLTGTIVKNEQSLAALVNDYKFTKVSDYEITISGKKTVSPADRWTTEAFEIELRHIDAVTGQVTPIGTRQTVSKSSSGYSFTLNESNFTLERLGTYYFQTVEIEPQTPIADMAYDKTIGWFGIIVTDKDIDGELEIDTVFTRQSDVRVTDGGDSDANTYKVEKDFTNVFNAANVTIPVEKQIMNGNAAAGISKANYMFGLYEGKQNENGKLITSVLTDTNGDAAFTFPVNATSHANEVFYTVREIKPDIENAVIGVTYNTDIYVYEVGVKWDSTSNTPIYTVYRDNQPVATIPIVVVNYYTETQSTPAITLSGIKTLNGGALRDGDSFTFELYHTDADFVTTGHTVAESVTVTKADQSIVFNPITFNTTGTKYMVVKEVKGGTNENGIRYDDTEYHITAHVNKKFDGNKVVLELTSYTIHKLGGANVNANQINFDNTYTINDTEEVTLKATKKLSGRDMLSGEFSFGLYENGKHIETVKNDRNGEIVFSTLTYTKPETHIYTVKEIIPDDKLGVDYDTTEYTVTVYITDNGVGGLNKQVLVGTRAYSDGEMVFNNSYSAQSAQLKLSGIKTLTGRATDIRNGEFTFELYRTTDSFSVDENINPVTATNNKLTAKTGGYEITLNYDDGDEGVYYYVLSERNPTEKYGVSYDTREYHITVMVIDNGKGALMATVASIVCSGMSGHFGNDELDFINDYNSAPATYVIKGKKDYNRTISEKMFEFELSDSTGVIGTVFSGTDGNYSFEEVELGYAGVHTFTVKEVNGGSTIKGIKYDGSVYTVKITVEDDNQGKLSVKSVEYLKDATVAEEIKFENEYSADATDAIKLKATKGVEGKNLENEEFTFELYGADANGNKKGSAISTAKNAANGNIEFSKELAFKKADTYKYVVVEKNLGTARITFDDTVYVVTIVVKDDGEGKLYIESKTYTADGDRANSIEFKNIYTPKPDNITLDIEGKKTVKNLGSEKIGPENFEFALELVGGDKVKVKSDKDGAFKFSLEYDEEDIGKTYDYKLYEINDGRENVKYSDKVYNFSVRVTLNVGNEIVATILENGEEADEFKAEFENEYNFTPTPPTPPAPPKEPESPKTGDNFNINLWLALLFVGGAGFFTSLAFGKRIKNR